MGGGYVYKGTGQDTLTPPVVMAAWNNRARALAGITRVPRLQEELDLVAEAERALALGMAARPRPEPPRELLPAEPEPAAPSRCGSCGYLETAIGHKVACGSPA